MNTISNWKKAQHKGKEECRGFSITPRQFQANQCCTSALDQNQNQVLNFLGLALRTGKKWIKRSPQNFKRTLKKKLISHISHVQWHFKPPENWKAACRLLLVIPKRANPIRWTCCRISQAKATGAALQSERCTKRGFSKPIVLAWNWAIFPPEEMTELLVQSCRTSCPKNPSQTTQMKTRKKF